MLLNVKKEERCSPYLKMANLIFTWSKLSKMSESDFVDAELMKSISAEFDIYEE